ncbi:MAG: hypothetical protein D3922_02015 [Candidatus Electrothrix sp. AR1]|nr:hypothetical protein [Candidatus Electrothrix sp. AR1]
MIGISMSFSIMLSEFFDKLGLKIVNKRLYRTSYFVSEAERLMRPLLAQYTDLVLQYPTDADHRKAKENQVLFLEMLHWLNLQSGVSRKILDIGGRGGLFAYYCNAYSHDAYISDLESVLTKSPNKELLSLFQVNSFALKIKPFEPLDTKGRKFDLITGFRTRFHSKLSFETGKEFEEHWGREEWDFFLHDLATNVLTEQGRIFFMLNRLQEREKKDVVPETLKELFRVKGGQLRQQFLYFPNTRKLL